MKDTELTARELEYLACDVPLISSGSAVMRITGGIFASILQAAITPGSGKADQKLMRTVREIRYTKYKKAVLHKQEGSITKKDEKVLAKLNKKPFILDADTYDPDEYTKQVYEAYMRTHSENSNIDNR